MSILKSVLKELSEAIPRPSALAGKVGIVENNQPLFKEDTNRLSLEFRDLKLKRCKYGWMLFSGPYIGKCMETRVASVVAAGAH